MRTTTTILVLGLLCSCDKTVPTPPGTTILDKPAFTKMSVTDWSVGAPTSPAVKVERRYHYSGDVGPDVRFKIAFEHGPSAFIETKPKSDTPASVEAPRAILIEVLENKGWAMTASCDDDLKVPLAVNPDGTSAYPKSVWARCSLAMKRKNGDITVAPSIEVQGDGKLVVQSIGPGDRIVED